MNGGHSRMRIIASELRDRTLYVLAGVSILLVSLAYQVNIPFTIDVGAPGDAQFLDGFHDPEHADDVSYRWSSDKSHIVFPGIGGYTPGLLVLRLNGHRPAHLPNPTVALKVNDSDIASFPVTDGFETYELAMDRYPLRTSGSLHVELHSETFVPHEASGTGDQRTLGVLVDWVSVQSGGGTGILVIPAPLPMILFVMGILASYLLARSFVSRHWALAVSVAILIGLCWLLVARRMQVTPYSAWILLIPGLALLVRVLAYRTTKTRINTPLFVAGVAAILLGLWRLASVAQLAWLGVAPDLANNFHTAVILRSGGMIYDTSAPLFTGYDNPPLTALFHIPLTLIDFQNAVRLFFGLNTLFLIAAVVLIFISRREYLLTYPYWLVAVAIVLNLDPLLDSLLLGQLDALICLLIVIAFVAYRQGRGGVAGSSLGLAAMIKFSPLLLTLYFLLKKQLRVFFSAIAAILGIGILSLLAAGFDTHVVFVRDILPTLLAGSAQMDNQSLNGFFNRLFLDPEFVTDLMAAPPLPQARVLTLASSLLIVGTAIYLSRRNPSARTDVRFDLEYSLLVITLPLVSSIAWHHYMTWYVLPLLVLLNPKLLVGLRQKTRWTMAAICVLCLLILSVPVTSYAPDFVEGPARLLISARMYAGLMLYGVFAYFLIRQQARQPSDTPDGDIHGDLE